MNVLDDDEKNVLVDIQIYYEYLLWVLEVILYNMYSYTNKPIVRRAG